MATEKPADSDFSELLEGMPEDLKRALRGIAETERRSVERIAAKLARERGRDGGLKRNENPQRSPELEIAVLEIYSRDHKKSGAQIARELQHQRENPFDVSARTVNRILEKIRKD